MVKDNQQPSSLNKSNNVGEKVQRSTSEDDLTNNLDTSALHLILVKLDDDMI